MIIVGITGGIGSGKSVVSQLLRVTGRPVYDCDSEARRIMETDERLRQSLIDEFGEEIYRDNALQRAKLADMVFGNPSRLERLNHHVHQAVGRHLDRWLEHRRADGCSAVFVESAILISSGFDRFVDRIWTVDAPLEVRKQRVFEARGMNPEDFDRRVATQQAESGADRLTDTILNDDRHALIPQVDSLLRQINVEP